MSLQTNNIYEFEHFRLDFSEKTLSNGRGVIPIAPKVFDTLCVLVENAGHLIEKDELMQKLWQDRFVEESNLTFNIKMLRKALGDNAHKPRFIETVQSRGYRFIAKVNEVSEPVAVENGFLQPVAKTPVATAPGAELQQDEAVVPAAAKPKHPTRIILFTVGFASAVFLIFIFSFNFRSGSPLAGGPVKSFAILPLKPINAASRDDIYENGIADSLIQRLSAMKGFIVRPLSATRKYAEIEQDALAAGKEQQVDYVLSSNYQLAEGKIKITAQLFNVANGQIEDTYTSEKDAASVFAIQDAFAGEVGDKLMARFATTSSGQTAKRGTDNEEAYRLYLQGMALYDQRGKPEKALKNFEQAVTLDPNYALAWAGIARSEEYQKSIEAANKALALDPNLSEGYSALCWKKFSYEYDFAGAERVCKRALELDPNSPVAHHAYSTYLATRGRFDEAIAEIKTAIDRDPTSFFNQRIYANGLYFARRYEEAVAQYKRMIEVNEERPASYNWLIRTLEAQGNESEAYEWFLKSLTLQKEDDGTIQRFKTAYQRSGWRGVLLEKELEFDGLGEGNHVRRAGLYAKLGNKDKAFEYLERGYQQHGFWIAFLQVEPQLDSLRDDPRFDDLVEEFRVTTTNANASQGRSSGAQISLVTKSGTNNLRGAIFLTGRRTRWTANNFFNNRDGVERPKFERNVFGGAIGGPMWKNRAFFFYSFEGEHATLGETVVRVVPLQNLGQGIVRFRCRSALSGEQFRHWRRSEYGRFSL